MLDYSNQLLEISSPQNLVQNSEYRVLDTRHWDHYWITIYLKKYFGRTDFETDQKTD
jgi:hypothetical protein